MSWSMRETTGPRVAGQGPLCRSSRAASLAGGTERGAGRAAVAQELYRFRDLRWQQLRCDQGRWQSDRESPMTPSAPPLKTALVRVGTMTEMARNRQSLFKQPNNRLNGS